MELELLYHRFRPMRILGVADILSLGWKFG